MKSKAELNNESGYGLLELLTGLLFGLYLLSQAVPGMTQMTASFSRATSLKQVEGDLRRARSEAIASGARSIVAIAGDGGSYTVGLDYAPYNSPPASDEVVLKTELPTQVVFASDAVVIFDPRGYSIDEDGVTQAVTATLSQRGTQFAEGTLFAAGYLEF